MTLKEWLKVTDPVGINIRLWDQYNNGEEPDWEGWSLHTPWIYVDSKIGTVDEDTGEIKTDCVVWFQTEKNEHDVDIVWANINIVV